MCYLQATRVKILISIVFLLFFINSSFAANSKVLIIPFENKTGDLEGIEKELTNIAIKQVEISSNYTYIPQDEFRKNWFGDLPKGVKEMLGIDTAEKIDLEKLRPMFAHDELGTISEYKERWGVDLVILGEIRSGGKLTQVYSEIIGMDTGRFYSVTSDCRPDEIKDAVRKQIRSLLNKGGKVQTVEADAEVDHKWSIVCYSVKTLNREFIKIKADYAAARPNPDLQDIKFIPSQVLKEGQKIYKIQTKENIPIELTFWYKNGQLEGTKIHTDLPSQAEGHECYNEVLSVVSQRGYVVNFTFSWRDKMLENVKVEPLINPFCAVN